MPFKISYHLPSEKEEVAEVVGTIPSNWCWIDGFLLAGKDLYEQGKIAENTRLVLSRWHHTSPTITAVNDVSYEEDKYKKDENSEKPKIPNFSDVFLKGKLVSSVLFNEAGFQTSDVLPLTIVKDLAQDFIRQGYKGFLRAYSGYRNNHAFDNPERFEISHDEGSIELQWNEKYGGRRENLDVFIEKFKELEIQERW